MCGITGFFSQTNKIAVGRKFYNSHRLLAHRGPDDEGFCALLESNMASLSGDDTIDTLQHLTSIHDVDSSRLVLGHRRLSIIDLSPMGHQPMTDESENYYIVYNGEIYNYRELREELRALGDVFSSQSDTEVVLKAIRRWGLDAFNKFNGMWALAYYDKLKDTLILSRDRFGVKPLYYTIHSGVLYFSSEMKFIRAYAEMPFTLNEDSAKAYLDKCLLNWNTDTFWQEIKELPPAHSLVYRAQGQETLHQYWTLEPNSNKKDLNEAVEEFAELFESSISLRMRSDVEVGCLLSGGLDSTTIVAALNKQGFLNNSRFQTFSAVFEDKRFSEKQYIDSVIKEFSLNGNFIYPAVEQVPEYTDRMLYYLDEPCRSLATYSLFSIYERIKSTSSVKVVLNGEGGDELFGGYTSHYFLLFANLLKDGSFAKLSKEISLFHKFRGYNFSMILVYTVVHCIRMMMRGSDFNKQTFGEVTRSPLREYLRYDDRTSMAFGIEARVPFLDYRLVEFAFSLDKSLKISDFVNKKVPRSYSSAYLPADVINRKDKMGFISPQEVWQKNELKTFVLDNCDLFHSAMKQGRLRSPKYVKLCEDIKAQKELPWTTVWRIVCLARWLDVNHLL